MKKYINRLGTFILLFTLIACNDFGDINVNPNEPVNVGTEKLLTNAQKEISIVVGATSGVLYAQHFSRIIYTQISSYAYVQQDFTWWYNIALANLQYIINVNTNPETRDDSYVLSGGSNANQIAVARILKAYFFQHLTDRWGPLPYSEALKGKENFTPAYDSQQFIYGDLINELKEAVDQIDSGDPVRGDILFYGDMARWQEFANTLRMVLALRMADVDESTASIEFNDPINDGVITSNIMYPYLPETANQNPWYARFLTPAFYAISNTMTDWLMATSDPRLESFADPTNNSVAAGNPEIIGMPYGLETPDIQPDDVSFPNSTYVRAQDAGLPIFTLAQVYFSRAEAAARSWTTEDAESLYRSGIMASWDQWGVDYDATDFESFYAQLEITYDAANWKELIGRQKWIALYTQGYESWAEWRRLDEPFLIPAEAPLNPSQAIPLREMYPAIEFDLNQENYTK